MKADQRSSFPAALSTGLAGVETVSPAAEARLQVSAFVDGELDAAAVERTIDALLASDELAGFWADAHRTGDWMRSDEVIGVGDGALFLTRLSARLAAEPTVLAPVSKPGRSRSTRFWVRTGLPGASVAAALVVVAWVASPFGRDDAGSRVATAERSVAAAPPVIVPTAVVAAAEPAAKAVDAEGFSDYLAAHRDMTPFGYRGAAARPAVYSAPSDAPAPR